MLKNKSRSHGSNRHYAILGQAFCESDRFKTSWGVENYYQWWKLVDIKASSNFSEMVKGQFVHKKKHHANKKHSEFDLIKDFYEFFFKSVSKSV